MDLLTPAVPLRWWTLNGSRALMEAWDSLAEIHHHSVYPGRSMGLPAVSGGSITNHGER